MNWIRHSIYAPWTLFFFLIIGFAQTGIGWVGGKLAVMALPSGVCSPKKKRGYQKLVELLALLLLPSTMFIGVANDKNQRDADDKTTKAQESEKATHLQLDEVGFHARHFDEATQRLLGSIDPNKLTPNQRVRYKEAQRASAQVAEVVSLKAPINYPATLPKAIVRPSTDFDAFMTDKANLSYDIEQTQSKLDVISEEFRRSKELALSPIMMQLRQGRSPQDVTAPYNSEAIRAALNSRGASFQRLLPEIEKERLEAVKLLKLSPKEMSLDNTNFNNAIKDSLQEVPVPSNWADVRLSPVFYQMNNYLRDIHQRLSEAP